MKVWDSLRRMFAPAKVEQPAPSNVMWCHEFAELRRRRAEHARLMHRDIIPLRVVEMRDAAAND